MLYVGGQRILGEEKGKLPDNQLAAVLANVGVKRHDLVAGGLAT